MVTLNTHLANIYIDFSNIICSTFDPDFFSQRRDRITGSVITLCSYHHINNYLSFCIFSPYMLYPCTHHVHSTHGLGIMVWFWIPPQAGILNDCSQVNRSIWGGAFRMWGQWGQVSHQRWVDKAMLCLAAASLSASWSHDHRLYPHTFTTMMY